MKYITLLSIYAALCWPLVLASQVIESSHAFFKPSQVNDWLVHNDELLLATDVGVFVFDENADVLLDHWTVASGNLPSNRVESITVNPQTQGLYIGTYDIGAALQAPDGTWASMPFPEEMVNSFNPILTYTLAFDQQNRLLIGTNQGLWRLTDGNSWENFGPNYFSNWIHSVWEIIESPAGEIFIGGNAVAKVTGDEFEIISPTDGGGTDFFAYSDIDLHIQSDGSLWAFSDVGVGAKYKDGEWDIFSPFDSEPVMMLNAEGFVLEDEEGTLWKYTRNNTFFKYSDNTWESATDNLPFDLDRPDFVFDNAGERLGVSDGVLYELTPNTTNPAHDLADWLWEEDDLWIFKNDSEGNVWAKSTAFSLINLTTGEELDLSNLGPQNYFSDYHFGTNGVLWLQGPSNSLFYLIDGELIATYNAENSGFNSDSYIRDFTLSEDGTPWVLDGGQYVYTLQNGVWQEVTSFSVANTVFDLQPGTGNQCFLSRLGNGIIEIMELSPEGVTNIDLPENWNFSYFTSFAAEVPGQLWTYNVQTSELGKWDGVNWDILSFPNDWEEDDRPLHFREENGQIWMTGSYQMAFYDGEQWNYYDHADRLWDTSRIYYAAMDREGTIWMTHNGVQILTQLTTNWGITAVGTLPSLAQESTLRIWPNPAAATIRGAWQAGEELRILNMKGQLLQNIKITAIEEEIEIARLPKGIYQLQLNSEEGALQNGLLLKIN
ncbi:MAG: T9SS type A sorting domain-containing protein [Lewinella sp.]|uniref:T9SS type A sorting domain-containing protein n=1 Tax=Lewinella sp. TaxID=2004506 RepID=UPI003D6A204A